MKGRLLFFIAAAAVFVFPSCRKEIGVSSVSGPERDVTVHAVGDVSATKGDGAADDPEKTVNSVQVFVYSEDDELLVNKRAEGTSVTFRIGGFAYPTYVLCNSPMLTDGVDSEAGLLAQVSRLSQNSVPGLIMFNSPGQRMSDFSGSTTVSVPVSRLAGRVRVTKVTNACLSDYLREQTFTVKDVHLTNVAGEASFGGGTVPSVWYNRMGYEGNLPSLTFASVGSQVSVDGTVTCDKRLYGYPNLTETDNTGTEEFCPRYTRVVVTVDIGGEEYFYPVSLPGFSSGKSYDLEVYIQRAGTKNEEHLLLFDEIIVYADDVDGFDEEGNDTPFVGKVIVIFNNAETDPFDYIDQDAEYKFIEKVKFLVYPQSTPVPFGDADGESEYVFPESHKIITKPQQNVTPFSEEDNDTDFVF